MSVEIIFGAVGLLLSIATFFGGVWFAKSRFSREERNARIHRVLDRYMEFRRHNTTGGYDGLQKAGVATLQSHEEIVELVDLIAGHREVHPLGGESNSEFQGVDLKVFFDYAARERVDFLKVGAVEKVIEQSHARILQVAPNSAANSSSATTRGIGQILRAERSADQSLISVTAKVSTIFIAIVAGIALFFSYRANQTMREALETEARPILAYSNARYVVNREKMSFRVFFDLENFGRTPAHEFKKINDKVLFVTKTRDFSDYKGNQAKLDEEYFFYRKGILSLLLQLFQKNPTVSLDEVKSHFVKLSKNPALVESRYLKSKKNKLAFKVDGYSDVLEWSTPPTMVPPNSSFTIGTLGRSSGVDVDQMVDSGKSMIVVFQALEYEGIKQGVKFQYYYLGYYDNRFGKEDRKKYPRRMPSFKVWSTR